MCSTLLRGVLPAASVVGFLRALALTVAGLLGERPGAEFWLGAVSVTATLGAVGCLHVGLARLAGLALVLAAGAVPALAVWVGRGR